MLHSHIYINIYYSPYFEEFKKKITVLEIKGNTTLKIIIT